MSRVFMQTWLWAVVGVAAAFHGLAADNAGVHSATNRVTTKLPLLVMPIAYADCKLTLADEDWHQKIFSTPTKAEEDQRFDLFGPSGTSLNNYYKEITCGKFQFAPVAETCGVTNDGIVRVSLDLKHPRLDYRGINRAVRMALDKAAQYVDFSKFDVNKDKVLSPQELIIMVISAGGMEDATFSKNLSFHATVMLGGCRIGGFVVLSERRDDLKSIYTNLVKAAGVKPAYKDFPVSVGTMVHELGHAFGTPDLPYTRYLTAVGYGQKNARPALFPGTKLEYSRNTPSHYGAYTMVKAGFVTPILLEKTGIYEVNSAGTGRYNVYKLATRQPQEYFLLENREQDGSDLLMNVKSKGRTIGGIAIWHINEAFGKNDDQDKQMVTIEEASAGPLGYSYLKKSRSFVALDPFYPLPGNAAFSSTSTPNNRSYSGEPQPWKLTDFSAPGPAMTFKFTMMENNQP